MNNRQSISMFLGLSALGASIPLNFTATQYTRHQANIPEPTGVFGSRVTRRRPFKARHRFKQPEGYYSQVITDERHKKPSQRAREAITAALKAGNLH